MTIAKAYNTLGNWVASDIESPRIWDGSNWIFPTVRIWDGSGWIRNVGLYRSAFSVSDTTLYTPAEAGIFLNTDGTVSFAGTPSISIPRWIETTATTPTGYQVYVSLLGGTLTYSSGLDTWLNIDSQRGWSVSVDNNVDSATISLQIRKSGTTDILSSSQMSFVVDSSYPGPIP